MQRPDESVRQENSTTNFLTKGRYPSPGPEVHAPGGLGRCTACHTSGDGGGTTGDIGWNPIFRDLMLATPRRDQLSSDFFWIRV